jgi:3-oxoacyl-[acyl-carrier protein] reductase
MNTKQDIVIISGGSRGLGLEIVKYCLAQDFLVATFSRKRTPEIDLLKEEYKEQLFFSEVDITDNDSLSCFVKEVAAKGNIYGLINNAAIGQDHLLANMSVKVITDIININLTSTILLTRLVLKRMMLSNNGGHIINISSICGSRGFTALTVYSATKGAIDAFTRSLAREVGERGIFVNSIAPGFFSSEMSSVLTEDQLETITRRTPTRKLTEPADVISALKFLLTEENNVTGQLVFVDGGAGV